MYKYISTKTYTEIGPVAYRQWRAESHCRLLHGYALSFKFEFGTNELDVRNWVVDYGSLRPLRDMLEEWFDHTLLVAEDDPQKDLFLKLQEEGVARVQLVEHTGCEALAKFLYEFINGKQGFLAKTLGYNRCWCTRVEVRETGANMAYVQGDPETNPVE